MRKGLTLTLMTVVIAVMGLQAMAMAPVVENMRDLIVGDAEDVSAANIFVYPDAIDLTSAATDDGLPQPLTQFVWSFYEGTGTYILNGKASLATSDDPASPPQAKIISATDSETYVATTNNVWNSRDTSPLTVTVRNEVLTPISGGAGADPGAAGFVGTPKAVTMFASDGDRAGSATLFVYSKNDGFDATSPTQAQMTTEVDRDFTSSQNGWTYNNLFGSTGMTSSVSGGMCLVAPAAGNQAARWHGPYGDTQSGGTTLVNNNVYRVRLSMTSNQTTAGSVPLWDVIFENQNDTGTAGAFVFGADYWFLDNQGSANAVKGPSVGRSTFDVWFAPLVVTQSAWQTWVGDSANAAQKNMRTIFRVIDYAANGYNAQADSGSVCITDMLIDRIAEGDIPVAATVFSDANLTAANWTARTLGDATTNTFSGGALTISPTSTWTNDTIIFVEPGDTNFTAGNLTDNYPIPWLSDTLYVAEADVVAANAQGESNPPDFVQVHMDSASNELFLDSYVTPNAGRVAMPVVSTTKTYKAFFYSQSATLASDAQLKTLRARFSTGALASITTHTNNGGVKLLAIRVKKLQTP